MYDPNDPFGYNNLTPSEADVLDSVSDDSASQKKDSSGVRKIFGLIVVALMSISIVSGGYFISKRTGFESEAAYSGKSYYLSAAGNDTNDGSEAAPFKTFSRGVSVLTPGDRLVVAGGVYRDKLTVSKNGSADFPLYIEAKPGELPIIDGEYSRNSLVNLTGSHIVVSGMEVMSSSGLCVNITGSNVALSNMKVHGCRDHGIYADGKNIKISGNEVYDATNTYKGTTASSGWGSGIKVRVGGENIVIEKNTVRNNWGEGIAVTRGIGAKILNNVAFDNYSVNIYVDNSINVEVDSNWAYCNANSGFERNGISPTAFAIAEEYYDGWGAKLANIKLSNNIAAFCDRGIAYFGSDVPGGGLDNVSIVNNTLYGSANTALSLSYEASKTRNTVVANNVVHQPSNKHAWIENRTGINMYNNFWVGSNVGTWTNAVGAGDKYGDVKFESTPTRNPASFRVRSDSPVVNSGSASVGLNSDFEKKVRDVIDMGAIEYGTASIGEDPQPTSSPTASPSATPTTSPSATPTPSPTPRPSATPTPTPTPTTNKAPVIKTSKLSSANLTKSYSATIIGYDVNAADNLTMTATGVPQGLSFGSCTSYLNSSGYKEISCKITGTPTVKGSYSIKLNLTDSAGSSVSRNVSIRVR